MQIVKQNNKSTIQVLILAILFVLASVILASQTVYAASNPKEIPKKGDTYTGSAVAIDGWDISGNRNAGAKLHNSGVFGDHREYVTAHCLDRDKYKPRKGYKYKYVATVKSVKQTKSGVEISGSITYYPTKADYAGGPSKTQRLSASWSFEQKGNPEIQIKKEIDKSCAEFADNNPNYSLAGTEYAVYYDKDCKKKIGTFKIGETGWSNKIEVEMNHTYYFKETKAGKGLKKDEKLHSIKNTQYNTVKKITVTDKAMNDPLFVQIHKKDDRGNNIATPEGALAGAEFTLKYLDKNRTWVFKTDKYGEIDISDKGAEDAKVSGDPFFKDEGVIIFPLGKYTIQETKAPLGFRVDPKVYEFEVKEGPTDLIITGNGLNAEGALVIKEKAARGDFEFNKIVEKRILTTFCDTCDQDITDLSKEDRDEKHGTTYYCPECGIDNVATHSKDAIEKHMKEKHPDKSKDDAKDDKKPETGKAKDGTATVAETATGKEDAKPEVVKYKTLTKLRSHITDSGKDPIRNPLADVTFKVTNDKTGESHIIKTDGSGNYNSKTDSDLWFGSDAKQDGMGKLEAGNYTIEEQECFANKTLILAKPKHFTVEKDGTCINLGTFVNSNNLIQTTALDKETGDHIAYGKKTVTIVDTVKYKNLRPGHSYALKGTLINKATGKAFLDKNNNPVTAKTTFKTKTEAEGFTEKDKNGTIQMPFTFEVPENFLGKQLVVFEEMTEDGVTFAVHASLDDQDQTVTIPKVGTEAVGKNTGVNLINGNSESETINDTVSYSGLLTGKTYTMVGYLVDKNGNEIEGTKNSVDFLAAQESGKTVVPLNINAKKYAGQDVVVFEKLYLNNKLIADHTDLKDQNQTIHISEVKTTAVNKETNINIINKSGIQTIVDTVTYKNLIAGKEYTLKGWLMDPKTNKPIEGTEATSKFTAENSDGETTIEFTFTQDEKDPLKKVVVFEELYLGDKLVGDHKDINDDDQTLTDIRIKTTAIVNDSNTNETSGIGEKKVIDTVHITGLTPGNKYTLKGWLMDETNARIENSDGEATFEATDVIMDVTVELPFNASDYAGKDVHAFEELYSEGKLIAEHKNLYDENQVVYVSKVETVATSEAWGNGIIPTKGTQYINDSVAYENLSCKNTYTLKSWVVDQATGKKIEGTDVTKEFKPESTVKDDNSEGVKDDSIQTPDNNPAPDDNDKTDDKNQGTDSDENTIAALSDEGTDNGTDVGDNNENGDVNKDDNAGNDNTGDTNGNPSAGEENKEDVPSEIPDKRKTFNRTEGTVETRIPVKGEDIKGKVYVVFQEIYDDAGVLVGEHKDTEAALQSIYGPEIRTKAEIAGKLSQLIIGKGKAVVKDTISYNNLERQNNYVIKSWLVDHKGSKIEGTETETDFCPDGNKGTITVNIPVDQSKINTTKLVAFEEITLDGKLVTDHKDINDKDQTVSAKKLPPTKKVPTAPKTGDSRAIFALVAILAIATTVFVVKNKKESKDDFNNSKK